MIEGEAQRSFGYDIEQEDPKEGEGRDREGLGQDYGNG